MPGAPCHGPGPRTGVRPTAAGGAPGFKGLRTHTGAVHAAPQDRASQARSRQCLDVDGSGGPVTATTSGSLA